MLFRKKISRSCSYCKFATPISEDQVLCVKKGVQPIDGECRKFKYEPLKRIPLKAKVQNFSQYSEEDFTL